MFSGVPIGLDQAKKRLFSLQPEKNQYQEKKQSQKAEGVDHRESIGEKVGVVSQKSVSFFSSQPRMSALILIAVGAGGAAEAAFETAAEDFAGGEAAGGGDFFGGGVAAGEAHP